MIHATLSCGQRLKTTTNHLKKNSCANFAGKNYLLYKFGKLTYKLKNSQNCYNTYMQKIIKFFKEVMVEFKNITWPKKDTLIQLTVVVISISIIVSLILGGFDYLFTNSIALLGNLKKQPTIETVQTINPSIIPLPTDASTAGQTKK